MSLIHGRRCVAKHIIGRRWTHSRVVKGTVSPRLSIITVPVLKDNYSFVLVTDPVATAEPQDNDRLLSATVVDPGEAEPILRVLKQQNLRLDRVCVTHHHADHVAGLAPLIDYADSSLEVVGPRAEKDKISGLNKLVGDNDRFDLAPGLGVRVLDTRCHTAGHVSYVVAHDDQPLSNTDSHSSASPGGGDGGDSVSSGDGVPPPTVAFTGDTLFVGGVGRFFEGTAKQMYDALGKLTQLPPTTLVFCGHEYTEANLEFALSLEPDNGWLDERLKWAQARRRESLPTVPSVLADELRTNVFLRTSEKQLAKRLGFVEFSPTSVADRVELLSALRERKNAQ